MQFILTVTCDDTDILARALILAGQKLARGMQVYDVVRDINADTLATASLVQNG